MVDNYVWVSYVVIGVLLFNILLVVFRKFIGICIIMFIGYIMF